MPAGGALILDFVGHGEAVARRLRELRDEEERLWEEALRREAKDGTEPPRSTDSGGVYISSQPFVWLLPTTAAGISE